MRSSTPSAESRPEAPAGHAHLIWWDAGRAFAARAMAAIRDDDQVYVSAASAWEIAIKASPARIETDRRLEDVVTRWDFEELPIRISHAKAVETLPPHHRDPFDGCSSRRRRSKASCS